MLTPERIEALAEKSFRGYMDDENDDFDQAFARAVEAEARSEALREAYNLMFDIKGDKVTRFDAQTAIRNLAAPADPLAWLAGGQIGMGGDRG